MPDAFLFCVQKGLFVAMQKDKYSDRTAQLDSQLHWVGVDDWETERFENLWPLPGGIAYNSYLIIDEKVALIDAVKANSLSGYWSKLETLLNSRKIDYLVINHMEPDHTGAVTMLRERFPDMRIIGNQKTAELLEQFYNITDNITIVNDKDSIETGKRKLFFYMTPMVHWPETMMTYDATNRVLFSGDAFGGYGALNGVVFADEAADQSQLEYETLRYFSNVIGRYSSMVLKALATLRDISVAMIAPTHGPIWRKNTKHILDLYAAWSRHETQQGVVLAYGSMYGNTESLVEMLGHGLGEVGIDAIKVHNVAKTHPSYILADIWRYKGLLLGTPTYNMKPFPEVDNLVRFLENKMMRNRYIGLFGSYGWSGGGVKALRAFAEHDKGWELVEPVVEAHGAPKHEDFEKAKELARLLAQKISTI